MSRVHVGGLALEIHEPTGEPCGTVLLLHGIGGCADTFTGVAPRLAAAGWRAVAWDAPGYGESPDPGPGVVGDDSPGAYVNVVARLLTTLGIDRAHLAGVSWGGVIATHVAARRPELVAGLILIDSTRGSGTTKAKAAAMRGRVSELEQQGAEAFAARRAPRLLADGPEPAAAAEVERQMSAVRVSGYAGAAEMMAQSDTGPLLPTITAPTLVLVGDEDRVTGVEESRLLARAIPQACFGLVGRAGHAAVQERPAEVAAAMLAFLDRLLGKEAAR
ncbi:alpha/beta fold hydrolase [Streptomyces umbrinus]|uniref:alpha/beta fold hydrolase n=1 Tax=Streptomyces umbrinus TaxID=67370 RepID=UPI0033CD218D